MDMNQIDKYVTTIRKKLPTDKRDRGDCPERAGVCWCGDNAAHDALDALERELKNERD